MCINQREITLSNGHRHYVNCGVCPACMQSKAFSRANLIKNSRKFGYVNLFITLTYSNRFIPYLVAGKTLQNEHLLPVHRDYDLRSVRGKDKVYYTKVYKRHNTDKHVIDCVYLDDNGLDDFYCGVPFIRHNHGYVDGRIGILYKPDIQNFFKRLRINYERDYKKQLDLAFFVCGEYGPKTKRPHYHALLRIPNTEVDSVSACILKSWKYCDTRRLKKYIEVERGAASYVSSYVNSHSTIQTFYGQKAIRQFSTHSKFYGLDNPAFSLPSVVEKVSERNLYYDVQKDRQGTVIFDKQLLPYYVISHWFPKITGFSKLSTSELVEVYSHPKRLSKYARKLGYTSNKLIDVETIDEFTGFSKKVGCQVIPFVSRFFGGYGGYNLFCPVDYDDEYSIFKKSPYHRNLVMLYAARQRYVEIMSDYYGIKEDDKVIERLYEDFAFNVVRVWSNYHSELIKNSHLDYDANEVYKNVYVLKDSPSLRSHYVDIDVNTIELSPNSFKSTLYQERCLTDLYQLYDKMKKVNNIVYSKNDYQF